MVNFSKKYKTFIAWLKAKDRSVPYINKITKLHKMNPKAILKQLYSGKNIIKKFSKSPFDFFSPKQKFEYLDSLEVLRKVRQENISPHLASQEVGIPFKKVLSYIKEAFYKRGKRYFALKSDKIFRKMRIYEKGLIKSIITTNYEDAKIIGEYHSAVGRVLYQRDFNALKPFEKIIIVDADGIKHTLETDPSQIFLIRQRIENPEFFEVYDNE